MRICFFLLACVICTVRSSRILGVFPTPSPSHYFLGSALMKELAERGHDVTVISPFGEKSPPKNGTYRDIVVKGLMEEVEAIRLSINIYERDAMNPILNQALYNVLIVYLNEMTLKDPQVQTLLNSNEKFDLLIIEQFVNDGHKALSAHFKSPFILFSTVVACSWVNDVVGNPSPPSYIPDLMLSYSSKMTYFERVVNVISRIFGAAMNQLYILPKQRSQIKKYVPNSGELDDVLYNASLVLMNAHPSLNQPVPYVPNMIDIGGFHIKPPKKLPKDLQEFLDSAKDGAIYFSMGSNLKSAEFPPVKRDAFLNTFAKLKQKVLWKWEDDVLPGQPPNVKLGKWLPQQDILAHPNIKVFITHGGLLSIAETVYHGIPVLAIPVFGDQMLNAKKLTSEGYGLALPFREITEESLTDKVDSLLNDPRFKNNAKRKSQLFHDRPQKPMDTAVYWTEYVIRHQGAPHLRVAGLDLPWYQYYLIDVTVLFILASLAILVVNYLIIRSIYRRFTRKQKLKSH